MIHGTLTAFQKFLNRPALVRLVELIGRNPNLRRRERPIALHQQQLPVQSHKTVPVDVNLGRVVRVHVRLVMTISRGLAAGLYLHRGYRSSDLAPKVRTRAVHMMYLDAIRLQDVRS